MNRRNIIMPVFIASAVAFLVGICLNMYLEFDASSEIYSDVKTDDEDDEVEEIITPTSEGYLTVFDYQGVTHFQYEGEIVIENDGSNGEPINIQIYIPPTDPAYDLED